MHQQRLGRLRQQGETLDKYQLGLIQQITVVTAHPGQNLSEVFEVVEGIFQGLTHCTSAAAGARAARSKTGYLYSLSDVWQLPGDQRKSHQLQQAARRRLL